MKFQMEVTKPYLNVGWHFYSIAWGLTPTLRQAQMQGWPRAAGGNGFMSMVALHLEGLHTWFNVLLSPS